MGRFVVFLEVAGSVPGVLTPHSPPSSGGGIQQKLPFWTAFGAFATALLLQTGTLAAPVAAHVFCNAQGMPPLRAVWKHSLRARIVLLTGILAFVVALWRLWAQPPALTGL